MAQVEGGITATVATSDTLQHTAVWEGPHWFLAFKSSYLLLPTHTASVARRTTWGRHYSIKLAKGRLKQSDRSPHCYI